jgi:hypothetical protein
MKRVFHTIGERHFRPTQKGGNASMAGPTPDFEYRFAENIDSIEISI